MFKLRTIALCILVACVLLANEVEGRRKILRGRKTITRTYYKQAAIPAWAIITIVSVIEVIIGVLIYVLLSRFYVGDLTKADNAVYRKVKTSA